MVGVISTTRHGICDFHDISHHVITHLILYFAILSELSKNSQNKRNCIDITHYCFIVFFSLVVFIFISFSFSFILLH